MKLEVEVEVEPEPELRLELRLEPEVEGKVALDNRDGGSGDDRAGNRSGS